jgi:hypothetical protein
MALVCPNLLDDFYTPSEWEVALRAAKHKAMEGMACYKARGFLQRERESGRVKESGPPNGCPVNLPRLRYRGAAHNPNNRSTIGVLIHVKTRTNSDAKFFRPNRMVNLSSVIMPTDLPVVSERKLKARSSADRHNDPISLRHLHAHCHASLDDLVLRRPPQNSKGVGAPHA